MKIMKNVIRLIKQIKSKMEIDDIKPHTIHRLYKNTLVHGFPLINPRNIIVKFSSEDQRNKIYKNRRLLKGTDIFMREDISKGTIDARNSQTDDLRNAISQGKYAYFKLQNFNNKT